MSWIFFPSFLLILLISGLSEAQGLQNQAQPQVQQVKKNDRQGLNGTLWVDFAGVIYQCHIEESDAAFGYSYRLEAPTGVGPQTDHCRLIVDLKSPTDCRIFVNGNEVRHKSLSNGRCRFWAYCHLSNQQPSLWVRLVAARPLPDLFVHFSRNKQQKPTCAILRRYATRGIKLAAVEDSLREIAMYLALRLGIPEAQRINHIMDDMTVWLRRGIVTTVYFLLTDNRGQVTAALCYRLDLRAKRSQLPLGDVARNWIDRLATSPRDLSNLVVWVGCQEWPAQLPDGWRVRGCRSFAAAIHNDDVVCFQDFAQADYLEQDIAIRQK